MNYFNNNRFGRFFHAKMSVPVIWFMLAYLVSYLNTTIFPLNPLDHPDALSYHSNATYLIQHGEIRDFYNELRAWRPPGATIFFAGIYALSGINPSAVVTVQVILFAIMVALLSDATTKITNNIAVGHVSGFIALIINAYYNYYAVLLSEQLHLFLLAATFWIYSFAVCVNNANKGMSQNLSMIAFALGVSIGLATLVKSYLFYFPIYLLGILVFLSAVRMFGNVASSWRLFLYGLAGFFLVISPFLVRNYIVIGSATKLVTYGGYNLFLGNYSLTHGDWLSPTSHYWYAEIDEKMATICATISDEVGRDYALSRAGLQIIKENFALFVMKFFVQSIKMLSVAGAKGEGSEKIISIALYTFINVLAAIGWVISYKLYKPISAVFLVFGSYVLIVFSVTFSAPRLNMPLTIMLPTLCAIAIIQLYSKSGVFMIFKRS